MDKITKLSQLKSQMEADLSLPLRTPETTLVFGDGNPDAKIYFLGEAPGFHENKQGKPFVGMAGKLLTQTLNEIGIQRGEVYISNVVRFRPPENRDPTPEELAAFAPYIDSEIKIIGPKIIVTLGRFSMGKFLPEVKISQVHGQKKLINYQGEDYILVPMYHPAAALRAGAVLQQFKQDFQILKTLLENSNPVDQPEQKVDESEDIKQLSLL